MKIYPAIDIRDGKCVRLMQGELQRSTEYGDPIEMAKRWEDEGAYYLHVVDLDAAFSGSFVNQDIITKLVQSIKIPVQMGGGVRTKEDIRVRLDDAGISRVILGTVAVEDPELVKWAVARLSLIHIYPGIRMALIHGKLKNAEKQEIMDGFSCGKLQILVSTTVIEVGINVPNATVMAVMNAERFGLCLLYTSRCV